MSSRLLQIDEQHKDLIELFTRERINITRLIAQPAYPEHNILKSYVFDAKIAILFANRTIKDTSFRDVILLQRDKKTGVKLKFS